MTAISGAERRTRATMLDWAPSLAAIVLSLVIVAAYALSPRDPQRVAAVFPPWWSAARALDAAHRHGDATIVGGAPYVVIVWSHDAHLAARLRRDGALLLLDPGLTAACLES